MATAECIDNDLRLLEDSMNDLEFILQIIIIIINTSSAAARQLMSVMGLGSAGNLISAKRSCILLETVDMFLVFLHNNYWYCGWFDYSCSLLGSCLLWTSWQLVTWLFDIFIAMTSHLMSSGWHANSFIVIVCTAINLNK